MKVYGRSADIPDKLLTLQEVSFLAGPEQLRSLARFFLAQAESQESGQGEITHITRTVERQFRETLRWWSPMLPSCQSSDRRPCDEPEAHRVHRYKTATRVGAHADRSGAPEVGLCKASQDIG